MFSQSFCLAHLFCEYFFLILTLPVVPLAGLRDSCVPSLVMLRGRDRAFFADDFCFNTLSKSSMTLSCWRRAYSPRVKSPRRTGVAGGVGEGEAVLEGEAPLLSVDPGLKSEGIWIILPEFELVDVDAN